jgi:flagellar hook-length control protein FliK
MGIAVEVSSVSTLGGGTVEAPSLTFDSGAAFGFLSALLSSLESQGAPADAAAPALPMPSPAQPEGEPTGSDIVLACTESGAPDPNSTHATSVVTGRRLPQAPMTGDQLAAQAAALGLTLPVIPVSPASGAAELTGEVEGAASTPPVGVTTIPAALITRDDADRVGTGPNATVVSPSLLPDQTTASALPAAPERPGPGQPPPARTEGDRESSPTPSVRAQTKPAGGSIVETATIRAASGTEGTSASTVTVADLVNALSTTQPGPVATPAAAQIPTGSTQTAQAEAATTQTQTRPVGASGDQTQSAQAGVLSASGEGGAGTQAGAQDSSQSGSQDASRSPRQNLLRLDREQGAGRSLRVAARSARPFPAISEGVAGADLAGASASTSALTSSLPDSPRLHGFGAIAPRDAVTLSYPDLDLIGQLRTGALRATDLSRVTVQLHPRELGEVRIAVESRNGQLSAHFQASHAAVQTWLEANTGSLRTQLAEAGLHLQSMTLSTSAEQRGQQQGTGQPAVFREPQAQAPKAPVEPVTITGVQVGGSRRLLDLLA